MPRQRSNRPKTKQSDKVTKDVLYKKYPQVEQAIDEQWKSIIIDILNNCVENNPYAWQLEGLRKRIHNKFPYVKEASYQRKISDIISFNFRQHRAEWHKTPQWDPWREKVPYLFQDNPKEDYMSKCLHDKIKEMKNAPPVQKQEHLNSDFEGLDAIFNKPSSGSETYVLENLECSRDEMLAILNQGLKFSGIKVK